MNRRDAIRAVMAIPSVSAIQKASLLPDDVIVVQLEGHISEHAKDYIRHQLKQIWTNQRVLVLDSGMSLRIIKQSDIA